MMAAPKFPARSKFTLLSPLSTYLGSQITSRTRVQVSKLPLRLCLEVNKSTERGKGWEPPVSRAVPSSFQYSNCCQKYQIPG